jgi:hypothetical protein
MTSPGNRGAARGAGFWVQYADRLPYDAITDPAERAARAVRRMQDRREADYLNDLKRVYGPEGGPTFAVLPLDVCAAHVMTAGLIPRTEAERAALEDGYQAANRLRVAQGWQAAGYEPGAHHTWETAPQEATEQAAIEEVVRESEAPDADALERPDPGAGDGAKKTLTPEQRRRQAVFRANQHALNGRLFATPHLVKGKRLSKEEREDTELLAYMAKVEAGEWDVGPADVETIPLGSRERPTPLDERPLFPADPLREIVSDRFFGGTPWGNSLEAAGARHKAAVLAEEGDGVPDTVGDPTVFAPAQPIWAALENGEMSRGTVGRKRHYRYDLPPADDVGDTLARQDSERAYKLRVLEALHTGWTQHDWSAFRAVLRDAVAARSTLWWQRDGRTEPRTVWEQCDLEAVRKRAERLAHWQPPRPSQPDRYRALVAAVCDALGYPDDDPDFAVAQVEAEWQQDPAFREYGVRAQQAKDQRGQHATEARERNKRERAKEGGPDAA